MALITRVTRLFRSDLHAVLDCIEEPHILIKQAVREMQESNDADEQRVKLLDHEHKQVLSRQADLDQCFGQIKEELDICFESGKDDLARALIKRKLETQRQAKALARKRNSLEKLPDGTEDPPAGKSVTSGRDAAKSRHPLRT